MTEMTLAEKKAEVARLQAEIFAEESRIGSELEEGGSIWDALQAAGAVEAYVEYSGSGDDGQVEDVVVYTQRNPDVVIEVPFTEALGEFVTEALQREGIDWYNDEGGYGTCTFNVGERRASIDHHQRYEASTQQTIAVA